MLGYLDFLFLGYSGRIGRGAYWLGFLALTIIQWVVIWLLLQLAHGSIEQLAMLQDGPEHILPPEVGRDLMMHIGLPMLIIVVLFLYPSYAICTKRWHDRGKSGWWSLIMFVPIIGGLWALIELGFLGGDEGANQYGVR
jgi:uncharacterized membrane protein YhaH (DUF805 family)